MLTLITGGSGSGKSQYAESLLAGKGAVYAAAMVVYDEESERRVKKHRLMRDGKGFITEEIPVDIGKANVSGGGYVLIECLSNLLANEIYISGLPEDKAAEKIYSDIMLLNEKCAEVVAVTNEIFSDGGEVCREYVRALGKLNQRLAEKADNVTEVVFGIPVKIKQDGGLK